jgi:8-oxo-dGTP pyrophosphatase MutT (NUDIX family)
MIASYEGPYREAFLNLLRNTAAPCSRRQFEPGHLTGSCFIIDDTGSRLLLHHHRRLNRWLQMGGHLEDGEQPVDAALREGREESGLLDLQIVGEIADLDVHVIPAGRGEPEHRHFDVRYIARTRSPEAIVIDAQESNELMWVDLDRAAALMEGEESQRVIRKIRRLI